jgi:hypothetical protein
VKGFSLLKQRRSRADRNEQREVEEERHQRQTAYKGQTEKLKEIDRLNERILVAVGPEHA